MKSMLLVLPEIAFRSLSNFVRCQLHSMCLVGSLVLQKVEGTTVIIVAQPIK